MQRGGLATFEFRPLALYLFASASMGFSSVYSWEQYMQRVEYVTKAEFHGVSLSVCMYFYSFNAGLGFLHISH